LTPGVSWEGIEDAEPPRWGRALLGVSIAALALAALPAAVGVAIMIGSTVPLEFAAAAALTILASIKLAAAGVGLIAVIRREAASLANQFVLNSLDSAAL
jgi:hypothetical protein